MSEANASGFTFRDVQIGTKHYRLFMQKQSVASMEGNLFGAFLLPAADYSNPAVKRLQTSVETEDEMWKWLKRQRVAMQLQTVSLNGFSSPVSSPRAGASLLPPLSGWLLSERRGFDEMPGQGVRRETLPRRALLARVASLRTLRPSCQ
jgi:hypothetical protein